MFQTKILATGCNSLNTPQKNTLNKTICKFKQKTSKIFKANIAHIIFLDKI